MEDFQKGKINTFEFCLAFKSTGKLTSDIIDIFESNFIILSPDEKALDFSNLIEEVFDLCQNYFQDLEFLDANPNPEEFEKSKIEFNNSLKKTYLKIQKFLNEEWKEEFIFFTPISAEGKISLKSFHVMETF